MLTLQVVHFVIVFLTIKYYLTNITFHFYLFYFILFTLDTIIACLRQTHNYANLIPTEIQTESNLQKTLGSDVSSLLPLQVTQELAVEATLCGSCGAHDGTCARPEPISKSTSSQRTRGGRHYDLPEGIKLEDCSIFYVGGESLTLTNIVMTHNKCKVRSEFGPVAKWVEGL